VYDHFLNKHSTQQVVWRLKLKLRSNHIDLLIHAGLLIDDDLQSRVYLLDIGLKQINYMKLAKRSSPHTIIPANSFFIYMPASFNEIKSKQKQKNKSLSFNVVLYILILIVFFICITWIEHLT
jgi:hypothetical protein